MKFVFLIFISLLIACVASCRHVSNSGNASQVIEFNQPVKVTITGYSGNIMEPFLTRDGAILLFNNLNSLPENTNLHWATKINDTTFLYKGEISGVNTTDLEGVPTLDNTGNLYFVTTRDYATTLSTVYQCNFSDGIATNVQIASGISKVQAGWVNFDVEVSADGQWLYFVDGQFDQSNIPTIADLIIAHKNASGFQRLSNSNAIMEKVNTGALEYAACISADNLELYFTRLQVPITPASLPEILLSKRNNSNEAFGSPTKIQNITGFVEAPTISPDQKTLYYHKKENNIFQLYMIRKK